MRHLTSLIAAASGLLLLGVAACDSPGSDSTPATDVTAGADPGDGADAGPGDAAAPDGGPALDGGGCPPAQVPTVEGCLGCIAAATRAQDAKVAAKAAHDACAADADCGFVSSDLACGGACPVAVSDGAGYAAALAQIDADFCGAYSPPCPYSTPGCAAGDAVCSEGHCAWQETAP